MIIDIANRYIYSIEHVREGKTVGQLILFTPDSQTAKKIEKVYEKDGFCKEAEDIIMDDETEISYVSVDCVKNSVEAFRSITSHYELFYYTSPDGNFILTDHMVNMLSYIPAEDRRVCTEGVCDVALYQHSYGKETYVKDVYRLGYGEKLVYGQGKLTVAITQYLQLGRYDLCKENGADVLERTLADACRKMRKSDCVNTLSGGVDSTITHIIMGNPKSVSGSYEYEKFLCEKRYALDAAAMLGANHTVYDIQLSEYMDGMKGVAESYGLPPYNLTAQVMHYTLAKNVETSQMMVSELAGAVYGLELRTPYTEEKAKAYPMEHPYNYANLNSEIARLEDVHYLEKIFGKEMTDRQLAKRNEYVLSRLKGFDTADISKDNCDQLGHLMYWYSNNGVSILEQTEMKYNKTVNALFSARKVVESFLSLDIKGRYWNEKYGEKPYAKELLARLLPAYEVNKPKLGGSLPRTWMVTEGPMSGYFMEHEIPDFIDKSLYDDLRNPSWENSWGVKYMIMYSIWYENVMKQDIPSIPSQYLFKTES